MIKQHHGQIDLLDEFTQNNIYEKEVIFHISQQIFTERSFNRMLSIIKLIKLQPGCFGAFDISLREYNQKQVEKIIDHAFEAWGDEAFAYMMKHIVWYLEDKKPLNARYKKMILKAIFTEFTSTIDEYYRFDKNSYVFFGR